MEPEARGREKSSSCLPTAELELPCGTVRAFRQDSVPLEDDPLREASLRRALSNFVAHYHAERPHQGKGNVILLPRDRKRPSRWACPVPGKAGWAPQVLLSRCWMNILTGRGLL